LRYSTSESRQDGFLVIQLHDAESDLVAEIVPEIGNNTSALKRTGRNFVWHPEQSLSGIVERRSLFGIPFLAPWANRLDESSYWVNGHRYNLNVDLGNLRFDHHHLPIHGLLLFEAWKVERAEATASGATVLSSFDFARSPKLMAQFPFAHRLEMTHTLANGRLHVSTKIISQCEEPIPVSLGFHPYFAIPGSTRNEWNLRLPAKQHVVLNDKNIPTGELRPVGESSVEVSKVELDDVYSGLIRGDDGQVRFLLRARQGQLEVGFGPLYTTAVIYAPRTGDFLCIEPMAAITNALNLTHDGLYHELQSVAPGGTWQEEFWVEPTVHPQAA
jgi:aldose 1-epimerase